MKIREKIFWVFFAGLILQSVGTVAHDEYIKSKEQDLRKKIESKKTDMQLIPSRVKSQEHDSIVHFKEESPEYQDLIQKRQTKQELQICIAQLVEKSMSEYWVENFPKYKSYIDAAFTTAEKSELSQYIGVAHFTLSCDIDTNYYKTMDEILYGPYWREFANFAINTSPAVIAKYKYVRTVAEQQFPYIYVRSVFYQGGKITTDNPEYIESYQNAELIKKQRGPIDSLDKYNRILTECVKTGRDLLRAKSVKPSKYMYDFNRLHNVSKIFTADINFLIESLFVLDCENIDLNSALFNKYNSQILQNIKQIMTIDTQITRLESKHNADIKQIEHYFENMTHDKLQNASQELQQLKIELSAYNNKKTK